MCSPSIRATSPATRSSTYWKDRVWDPSPNTVRLSPRRAWAKKLLTTRPSSNAIRGP